MRLAYISFWSINDGLTQATVLPVVRYLLKENLVRSIKLFTPEEKQTEAPAIEGMEWHPVVGRKGFTTSGFRLLLKMTWHIGRYLQQHKGSFDMIWARASIAGGAAAVLSRWTGLPFGVESFEPHADYMVESGAWKRGGIKHRTQEFLQQMQRKNAKVLIAVSEQYEALLKKSAVGNAIVRCIPCTVSFEQFKFDSEKRKDLRYELQVSEGDKLGVYVGKLGDIYYDETFLIYLKAILDENPNFHMLFLSPRPERIKARTDEFHLPQDRITTKRVAHDEVPDYLSAADIGFCPVKTSPSKRYCSPVKTGEYFACGLPVVISEGIGDDSAFIAENKLGKVVDFEKDQPNGLNFTILASLSRGEIRSKARTYRDETVRFETYKGIFNSLHNPS